MRALVIALPCVLGLARVEAAKPAEVRAPARSSPRSRTSRSSLTSPSTRLAPPPARSPRTPAWLKARRDGAWRGLQNNIGRAGGASGAVVAAPGGNVEYQFHWTRDGAVAMHEVVHDVETMPAGVARDRQLSKAKAFVRYSWRTMKVPSLTGLGEPKFGLDGSAFNGEWGRPQNDGPALRALTSVKLARALDRKGETKYVRRVLLGLGGRGRSSGRGLIRADADYLVEHWREPSFDLWEEVKGDHFYTRIVQHAALAQSAELAREHGDPETASRYASAAAEIDRELDRHWDGSILRATIGGDRSGVDAAVVIGVLHSGAKGRYGVLDDRVLATARKVETSFRKEYGLNRGGKRGVLIGRYPEDEYTGQPFQNKPNGGNPWVLTTHAFAEYHYRVAAEAGQQGPLVITKANRPFFQAALPTGVVLKTGTVLQPGSKDLARLQGALIAKGDVILKRVEDQLGTGGVTREQIQRNSGALVGAEDLTWNHASFLSAARARDDAMSARVVSPLR